MDYQTTKVEDLARAILQAKAVIPDFQREYVWKPDDVRELLVSICGDYHIGTMLYMDSIADESPFALRPIEGVLDSNKTAKISSIVKILLDGQQRSSSIFYALYAPNVPLSGRKKPFRFFAHIKNMLDQDWDSAIEFVNTGNVRALKAAEASADLIAFPEFRDTGKLSERLLAGPHKTNFPDIIRCVQQFNSYNIHMVELPRDTPLDRVVETFERINRTGLPLKITDLLVAKLYQHDIKLRSLIEDAEHNYVFLGGENEIDPEFVLRVMCLLRGLEVRKSAMLGLAPTDFHRDWILACECLEEAYGRLTDHKHGYGVLSFTKFAPFTTMIIPLAALIGHLRQEKKINAANYQKIDQWYWASVFDNRYNEGVNTNTVSDVVKMKRWFEDDAKIPDFIHGFDPSRVDLSVTSKSSSIYRGVLCLVVLAGARDFKTGRDARDMVQSVQDDHIFPRSKYESNILPNRTLISTNSEKGDKLPSKYFAALETLVGRPQLEGILKTHLIDANGLSALLGDNFNDFVTARERVIRNRISELVPSRAQPAEPRDVSE